MSDFLLRAIFIGVGVVSGVVQYLLLQKFTGSATTGKGKSGSNTIAFALTQFLLPFVVLVVCILLYVDSLIWVVIGIASALIICAVVKYIIVAKSSQ